MSVKWGPASLQRVVRKAVVLAAGLGTRFLPTTRVVPKELLPLLDRPAIHYIVEECSRSGIEEVILVISRGKEAVGDYFKPSPALEAALERKGDLERLRQLQEISGLVTITTVLQKDQRGTGDAVLAAEAVVAGEPFLMIYPDDVMVAEPPVAAQVIEVFRERDAPITAVERVPDSEVKNYGIADGEMIADRLLRVERMVEKPDPSEVKSRLAVFGRYVLTPDIFDAIRRTPAGALGEVQLTDAFALLASERPAYAYEFEARRYDTGRPMTMLKAAIDVALSRDDTRDEMLDYLRQLKP
ncbi:MAG: NTP transferase domain-containing protein [Dehalococcoidia bacterium]|nr:NTP transferase domain-containing protein [Dehalococcoidia bacterium]